MKRGLGFRISKKRAAQCVRNGISKEGMAGVEEGSNKVWGAVGVSHISQEWGGKDLEWFRKGENKL